MYPERMMKNVGIMADAVNRFRENLILIRDGTDPREIRDEFVKVEGILSDVYGAMMNEEPYHGLEQIHLKVLEASGLYLESVRELMKFYEDNDDDHFIYAGLKANEAGEIVNEVVAMFHAAGLL